jgi:cytochrome P450
MTTLQAVCLGAMLAWTPSLVVLALLLREAPLDELERDPSRHC